MITRIYKWIDDNIDSLFEAAKARGLPYDYCNRVLAQYTSGKCDRSRMQLDFKLDDKLEFIVDPKVKFKMLMDIQLQQMTVEQNEKLRYK